jgi:hypothetical protein
MAVHKRVKTTTNVANAGSLSITLGTKYARVARLRIINTTDVTHDLTTFTATDADGKVIATIATVDTDRDTGPLAGTGAATATSCYDTLLTVGGSGTGAHNATYDSGEDEVGEADLDYAGAPICRSPVTLAWTGCTSGATDVIRGELFAEGF